MPVTAPPPEPYAWVVDYRPLDRCEVPRCRISGRAVSGFAASIESDGDPGSYVLAGTNHTEEVYLRRGFHLRSNESFSFTVSESAYESEFDAYFSTFTGNTDFAAEIAFDSATSGAPAVSLGKHEVRGHTAAFAKPTDAEAGHAERYRTHARIRLPPRVGRQVRVTIKNVGSSRLALGTPVVMRKVTGRGPRQVLFSVFDAIPFHMLGHTLGNGMNGDKDPASWLGREIAGHGLFFPNGRSPGQGTANFTLRFFRGGYWEGQGWPGMFGKGIDESLPAIVPGPVGRLGEQGFLTEFVGNNFLLEPVFSSIGFDGIYQVERTHEGSVAYAERWIQEHPRDDAFLFWWYSAAHPPYGKGRGGPPAPVPDLPASQFDPTTNGKIWANLLSGLDGMDAVLGALRRGAPEGDRVVWVSADHSTGITERMKHRPFRIPKAVFGTGLAHACTASSEEGNTPFAVMFDGPPGPRARVVTEPTNSLSGWRAVEWRFGLDLGLPWTTSFTTPAIPSREGTVPWDDRILVTQGATGALRATRGRYGYAAFRPRLDAAPLWTLPVEHQRVMLGTPFRTDDLFAEELYDESRDAYDHADVGPANLDVVVTFRRDVTDFMAAHFDPSDHPRHKYVLILPERRELVLSAPTRFAAIVDGVAVTPTDGKRVVVNGARIEVIEQDRPVGVIEIAGFDRATTLVCAGNGLPLDAIAQGRSRFDLAVARTNCPLPEASRDRPRPGEVFFHAEPAPRVVGASEGVVLGPGRATQSAHEDELLAGMRRWGYVRDIEKK